MHSGSVRKDLAIQDYPSQAFTEFHPGGALGLISILAQIRSPGTPTTANGALPTLRKWADLHGRARKLGVAEWPGFYGRDSAFDGIISAGRSHDKRSSSDTTP